MKLFSFDQGEHTPSRPYCGDATCWCHTNTDFHDEVQHPERRTTESDVEVARSFFFGNGGYETTSWGGAR